MHRLLHAPSGLPAKTVASLPEGRRLIAGTVIGVGALLFAAERIAASGAAWLAAMPPAQAAALESGLVAALATALGALPALFMRGSLNDSRRNALLGFSAGIMLAASFFSLLLPAIESGSALLGARSSASILAALALAAGVAGMLTVERLVPHSHDDEGGAERRGVLLMVLAIAIHNFPEGLAIGAALGGEAALGGQTVAWAIALQDMPEGLVVSASLVAIGMSRPAAFAIGAASGLAEPLAAVLGAQVIGLDPLLYPIGLAMAAGAMLFVVSHEIIPGTHRRGGEAGATRALTLGFACMMVLEGCLGGA